MNKFLVVHDRESVAIRICDLIKSIVPDAQIDRAQDGATARQRLSSVIYDLLILDLTLPPIKGRKEDYKVADQLLQELFNVDSFNVPGDIIGVTVDPLALESIENSLGPHLMVLIAETTDDKWLTYLADKVRYSVRASVTRQISVNQHFGVDLLIVTALDSEFAPYKSKFDFTTNRHVPNAHVFAFRDKDNDARTGVAFSIGKSGPARAASETQSLISYFRPRLVIMSGFCGGVEGKVKFGDLIVSETVYDWDYGKWELEELNGQATSVFRARPNPISIDGSAAHRAARELRASNFNRSPDLLDAIKQKSVGQIGSFEIHLKPTASGAAVVGDEAVIARIRGLNDAIWGVDMECYGVYYACRHTRVKNPEFLCIKAVADFCNGDKGDTLHEACCELSSSATIEIVTKRWDFS